MELGNINMNKNMEKVGTILKSMKDFFLFLYYLLIFMWCLRRLVAVLNPSITYFRITSAFWISGVFSCYIWIIERIYCFVSFIAGDSLCRAYVESNCRNKRRQASRYDMIYVGRGVYYMRQQNSAVTDSDVEIQVLV